MIYFPEQQIRNPGEEKCSERSYYLNETGCPRRQSEMRVKVIIKEESEEMRSSETAELNKVKSSHLAGGTYLPDLEFTDC